MLDIKSEEGYDCSHLVVAVPLAITPIFQSQQCSVDLHTEQPLCRQNKQGLHKHKYLAMQSTWEV